MAINFGDTIMEGGIAPSVAVQNPVQDDSGAVLAESLGGAAKAIGQIAGSIFQQGQVDANTKILTSYEQELLDLADTVEQGGMNRNEAMMRARAIRSQYLSNAPALQTDLDKVWTNFATANGLGHVVVQGTVEEQAQEARETEATKLGYNMQEYDVFQARARQATALNQELEVIKANGGIITETQRLAGIQAAAGLADAAFPSAQKQINDAMAAITANPGQKPEIIAGLNSSIGQSIAQLQQLTGGEGAAYLTVPIQTLLDSFNKWGSGEIENATMEAMIKETQLKYTAMYTLDPMLGPLIAQSKMLNDIGLATEFGIKNWSPEAIKKLQEVPTLGSVNLLDGTEGSNRFASNIVEVAGLITPASDPTLVDEVMASVNAAVEGVWVNERSAKDGAIGFKDTVEMLGSPQVGQLIQQAGGIDAAHADQFVDILTKNYDNELTPAIKAYWESVPVQTPTAGERVTPSNIPMNQLLQPVWNGSAVEFIPKPEYASDPRIVSLANDVNTGSNSIGVPLNNLINAYANVTGTDAKTIWEQDFAVRLFNLGPDGKPVEVPLADRVNEALDASAPKEEDTDTLSMGEFNPDTLEPVAEYVTQASSLVGSTPIDPAYTDVEGVDYDSYLPSIRSSESGGNDSAQNPTSTATGRYQFLKSTWTGLVDKYPNSGLTYEGRMDPQQQEIAIRLFTAENARMLKSNGVPLSNGTLYGAHFLGASDAVQVLKAPDSDLVAAYVPARVIQANPFLKGKTVAWFKDWINRKGNA